MRRFDISIRDGPLHSRSTSVLSKSEAMFLPSGLRRRGLGRNGSAVAGFGVDLSGFVFMVGADGRILDSRVAEVLERVRFPGRRVKGERCSIRPRRGNATAGSSRSRRQRWLSAER